ncbi:GPW/gp25 family protein [Nonomuraea typhae]|uniref:GPW/gp25 family protein n=1 Tax=Nonomuraea typhae TaxID=2603600 RepID=UPI0012FC8D6F|nr:GPW/gp25 family protein [Nonomuraea typhae]
MALTLPSAIDLPFRIENGAIASNRDVDRQIRQRLIGIIGTNPGERVMQPTLGVGVARMLFETDIKVVTALLTTDIKRQAAAYEPGAVITRVIVTDHEEPGKGMLDVAYRRTDASDSDPAAARHIHTATIGRDGTVKEHLRG